MDRSSVAGFGEALRQVQDGPAAELHARPFGGWGAVVGVWGYGGTLRYTAVQQDDLKQQLEAQSLRQEKAEWVGPVPSEVPFQAASQQRRLWRRLVALLPCARASDSEKG